MKRVTALAVLGLALTIAGTTVSAQEKLDRTVLPPPDPSFQGKIDVALKDSKADWPEPLKAPTGSSLISSTWSRRSWRALESRSRSG